MVEYGSLDNIYAHIEEITKKSIRESLENNKDLAELSRVLATIKTDCEISLDYEAARAEGYYTPEAYQLFKQLEFKNCFPVLKDLRWMRQQAYQSVMSG